MSRIGLTPISIPTGVTVDLSNRSTVAVKGPKGSLSITVPSNIKVSAEDSIIKVTRKSDELQAKANHGLIRSLINNMIIGVSVGFTKKLEMIGTGYRAKKTSTGATISAGYSHPIDFVSPEGVTIDVESETIMVVSGIDKQAVGETAAKIRDIRKPEPYKGKGIRYVGEIIRRKAGKATKAGA